MILQYLTNPAGEVVENDSDIARNALALQVYKNISSLIIIHIADVERIKDFYDLSITKRKISSLSGKATLLIGEPQ